MQLRMPSKAAAVLQMHLTPNDQKKQTADHPDNPGHGKMECADANAEYLLSANERVQLGIGAHCSSLEQYCKPTDTTAAGQLLPKGKPVNIVWPLVCGSHCHTYQRTTAST